MACVSIVWFALGMIAALHGHAWGVAVGSLIGFCFLASVVLYYRNANLWADSQWVGKTDILGRRSVCSRADLGSAEYISRITRRLRFLRKDGRLAFEINLHAWRRDEIGQLADYLGV